jgi:hypothetical protein
MFSTFSSSTSVLTKQINNSLIGTNWSLVSGTTIIGDGLFTGPSPQTGSAIAMNSTGKYILAICRSTSKIIVSADYGSTWTLLTTVDGLSPTFIVVGCACSALGDIMYLAFQSGNIKKSTNYGKNWTNTTSVAGNIYGVCCSADGLKILTASCDFTLGINMYLSTDGGDKFNTISTGNQSGQRPGPNGWISYGMSPDGSKIMGCVPSGNIYYSTNNGGNWTIINSQNGDWGGIAVANDGTATVTCRSLTGLVLNSVLRWNGSTWTGVSSTIIPTDLTRNVSCSADGKIILIAQQTNSANGGYLYLSRDSGVTWEKITVMGTSIWQSIAVSANGTRIMCAGSTINSKSGLYVSYN